MAASRYDRAPLLVWARREIRSRELGDEIMTFGYTSRCKCGKLLYAAGGARAAFRVLPSGARICVECADKLRAAVIEMRGKLAVCSERVSAGAADANRRLVEAMRHLETGDIKAAEAEAAAAKESLGMAESAVGEALAR